MYIVKTLMHMPQMILDNHYIIFIFCWLITLTGCANDNAIQPEWNELEQDHPNYVQLDIESDTGDLWLYGYGGINYIQNPYQSTHNSAAVPLQLPVAIQDYCVSDNLYVVPKNQSSIYLEYDLSADMWLNHELPEVDLGQYKVCRVINGRLFLKFDDMIVIPIDDNEYELISITEITSDDPHVSVTSYAYDAENRLWAATTEGDLYRYDNENNHWELISSFIGLLRIMGISENSMWLATAEEAAAEYMLFTFSLSADPGNVENILSVTYLWDIYFGANDVVWIVYGDGITAYHNETVYTIEIPDPIYGISHSGFDYQRGLLYITNYEGVYYLDTNRIDLDE
jgi:hypothetical protein